MNKPGAKALWRPMTRLGIPIVAAAIVVVTGATAETQEPSVRYELSSRPSAAGWFREDVTVGWSVGPSDGTLRSTTGCESPREVIGETGRNGTNVTCTAVWRNGVVTTRESVTIKVKIDKTSPTVRARASRAPDSYGWYDHRVRIRYGGRDALSGIARCSRRSYRGPNSARASVTGSCRDRAGNSTVRTVRLKYANPLLSPKRGTRVRRAPLLDWVDVRRARFYNVQVWRDGSKILSRWPERSRLRMPSRWMQDGVRYSLSVSGRYDVYVWPRFRGRYGKRIDHTYFVRR
jgi:hypothetical protein